MPEPLLIDTGKAGYKTSADFNYRAALIGNGDQRELFAYDALLSCDLATAYWAVFTTAMPFLCSRSGYSVLDFGCGYGRCANFLTMFDYSRYVGVEPQSARREYATVHAGGHARTFVATLADLPVGDTFDVIWCCNVLQHMVRPEKLATAREFVKRLAPGGIVIMYEGEIIDGTEAEAEARYRSEVVGLHPCMIPVPLSDMRAALAPLAVSRGPVVFLYAKD